jgi:hypothetical protein
MARNLPVITIPVNTDGLTFMGAGTPAPKIKDRQTGELKTDASGQTLYEVPALMRTQTARQGEPVTLVVPGDPAGVDMGIPLAVSGLVAYVWGIEDDRQRVRYGVSWRAASVTPAAQAVAR